MQVEEFNKKEYKLSIIGAHSVGKSSLLFKFLFDEFNIEEEGSTVEDEYFYTFIAKKNDNIENNEEIVSNNTYNLRIKDTGPLDDLTHLKESWFSWADGFLFLFNIFSKKTLDLVEQTYSEICKVKGLEKVPMVIVGTKVDQDGKINREVQKNDGLQLALKLQCSYIETSAKEGYNIQQTFQLIIKLIEKYKKFVLQYQKQTKKKNKIFLETKFIKSNFTFTS
jgi:small GTP-binding protein